MQKSNYGKECQSSQERIAAKVGFILVLGRLVSCRLVSGLWSPVDIGRWMFIWACLLRPCVAVSCQIRILLCCGSE